MKQLTCEMCGSTDLIKDGGVFVCQSCGTKYSAEEAKKLMIEGTVDVSGSTVKVDTSEELNNLYEIARRAGNNNDCEGAAKYYDKILQKDPNSWEAAFYSVFYRSLNCRIIQIASAAKSIQNCIESVMLLIAQHIDDDQKKKEACMQIAKSCIAGAETFFSASKNAYDSVKRDSTYESPVYKSAVSDFVERTNACAALSRYLGSSLLIMFPADEDIKKVALLALKNANEYYYKVYTGLYPCWQNHLFDGLKQMCSYATKIINEHYEINYSDPFSSITKSPATSYSATSSSGSGGCYVATAVYGSYDCPQVWTLRRFRDYTLAETWYGRAFIRTYYVISPTLVKWFGHTDWFKKMWKGKLDRMVANLNAEGVEDTPYKDRNW